MAAVDDIKSRLDLSQIAQTLGTDEQTANQAVDQALAQLVGGLGTNATDADSAVGLSRAALNDHAGTTLGDRVDINDVDTADGEKIIHHVFSDNQIQSLSSAQGGNLLRKLLPILAPIVMGYLASKLQERMGSPRGPQADQSGGGGLGDILGDLLGGGRSSQQQSGGGGLGDILGDLLGGGSQAPQQTPQAPTSGDRGFNVPGGSGGELRMDPGTPSDPAPQQGRPAGGGDLGGILQDILFGGRR
ncbi:MAG: DUF937 domain-containing protein [Propionibacteriaceae bacterium]|nr:DUF937 domain-containing protein [Propionibacteriaceae bacterium]